MGQGGIKPPSGSSIRGFCQCVAGDVICPRITGARNLRQQSQIREVHFMIAWLVLIYGIFIAAGGVMGSQGWQYSLTNRGRHFGDCARGRGGGDDERRLHHRLVDFIDRRSAPAGQIRERGALKRFQNDARRPGHHLEYNRHRRVTHASHAIGVQQTNKQMNQKSNFRRQ